MALLGLLTDFGTQDAFAGIMKAVIYSLSPGATVVDISHGVPPRDVAAGALMLESAFPYFPGGSVFAAVIDPGVGTSRQALLMEGGGYFFVAPDNGLLTLAARRIGTVKLYSVTCGKYFLPAVSSTFHGRDIFAPVAAYLLNGVSPGEFGEEIREMVTLPFPEVTCGEERLEGEIVAIDRFGNLISNIRVEHLKGRPLRTVLFRHQRHEGVACSYEEGGGKPWSALFNSSGALELFVYGASASEALCAGRGEAVTAELA
ncbi:MAG: SAM-dependent chlorinase/fluorinase [Candidatus Eremiobacteraeota bacterium]|nr:SAM-dependent chlorinase/fluorinase [Candidatus Eremiobacteraeota bacterium]